MEHKKTMDNRTASADEKALRDKKALELGPPIYAPPREPGERFRIEKIRRKSRPPLKEEEKPQQVQTRFTLSRPA